MRVLGVFHAYPPTHNAGAEWMAHAMLRHLVAHGHQVRVALSRPGRPGPLDGVEVVNLPAGGLCRSDLYGVDVVVTHLENTAETTRRAREAGVPAVHLLHNTFPASKQWARLPGCALLVANSEWMRADFATVPGLPRTVVVRPPVDWREYATTPGDLVTIINLFANKGGHHFWRLAAAMPDTRFLAVQGAYGRQVIPPVVPPNVTLAANTPRIRDEVYARTRILLMPSEYESWGRTGVEAMASGIPVIAHPTPGLRESLGDAGIFVDRDDTAGWADAIAELSDPDVYAQVSRRAAARARELDPAEDLETWRAAVESLAGRSRCSLRPKVSAPRGDGLDVVYPVKRTRDGNEELRYSLRSLHAHVPHGRVWVLGDTVQWLANVTVLPRPQEGIDQYAKVRGHLAEMVRHPDCPPRFALWNDDFFRMAPLDAYETVHRGPLATMAAELAPLGNRFARSLTQTLQLLTARGITQPLSYEHHQPLVVDRDVLRLVLDRWADLQQPWQWRSVLANVAALGGVEALDVKVHDPAALPAGGWASTSPAAWQGATGQQIRARFTEPSPYEKH